MTYFAYELNLIEEQAPDPLNRDEFQTWLQNVLRDRMINENQYRDIGEGWYNDLAVRQGQTLNPKRFRVFIHAENGMIRDYACPSLWGETKNVNISLGKPQPKIKPARNLAVERAIQPEHTVQAKLVNQSESARQKAIVPEIVQTRTAVQRTRTPQQHDEAQNKPRGCSLQ